MAERVSKKPSAAAAKAKKKAAEKAAAESAAEDVVRILVEDGQEFIKTSVLKDLDLIAAALVAKAKAGGTAHLRLLWALGKMDADATATVKQRAPSLSALLMHELSLQEAAKKTADK